MAYKFNARCRHKFDPKKYSITNWSDYNESLRRRGDVTMWIDENVVDLWAAPTSSSRARPAIFSDYAIEICLQVGCGVWPGVTPEARICAFSVRVNEA